MALRVGDRVQEQARSTSRPGRAGVVREVVRGDPAPRYRIGWDDDHETVYMPAAGSLHLLAPAKRTSAGKALAKKAPAAKKATKTAAKKASAGKASAKKPR